MQTCLNFCNIVYSMQDINKQDKVCNKIADEQYLQALKIHQDPRNVDMGVSVEIMNIVDKLVHQKIGPMSVEPEQRFLFENWKKHKAL